MMNSNEPDYQRVISTILIVAIILIGWQMLVEWPRRQQLAQLAAMQSQKIEESKEKKAAENISKEIDGDYNPNLTHSQRLALSERVSIKSDKLHGSIALRGARFDDLTLAKYKVSLEKDSDEVVLLAPNGDDKAYFAQAGWIATDGKTRVPDGKSVWKADKNSITSAGDSATLRWDNGEGIVFFITISLDNDYMFRIHQRAENNSAGEIKIAPYAYINRSLQESSQGNPILHEGPIGVVGNELMEISYTTLREKGDKIYENAGGWLGITDKYWLTALVPDSLTFKGTFGHYNKNNQDRYQVDYLGVTQTLAVGATFESNLRFFAGAKEINVLDRYAKGDERSMIPPIPLFDRSVDFGMLYFLTKPLFLLMNFLYAHIGNFGLAIMMVTILVKLCMYPLANKSYIAMAKLRVLQPEILKLKERFPDDQMAMNREMLELYKRHKVNPASGCLPLLIQMPVFFALYKVLYVTIEMRHAPFFGWLKDLSAADPSNLFTLFGLISWQPPSFLHLGFLPILYTITMIIQQKQQPAPTDPTQAQVLKFMPFVLLFVFNSFPAGLVLYWVWSNILSIIQQEIISIRHGTHRSQTAKAKAV